MSGKSPYFNNSRHTKLLAIENLKGYRTKPKIKVEYDTEKKQEEKIKKEEPSLLLNSIKKETQPLPPKHDELIDVKSENIKCKSRIKKENIKAYEPDNWQIILKNIQDMRKHRDAVVDSMGCERTADKTELPNVQRFQYLISLMLSSQTRDQVTFAAMERLKKHKLTVSSIMNTSISDIEKLIYPVGFWKRKSEYIKKASVICHEDYNDDIPDNLTELIALPGVGPKMGHICMKVAWGEITGIGVDTHVHRIANRLKWVNTKQPEETRLALEQWMPRDEWDDLNILLVGFGQQTCLPVHPKCQVCLNQHICPSAFTSPPKKPKTEKS